MKPDDDPILPTIDDWSSPLILDSDMGDSLQDTDLEFFDSTLPHDPPASDRALEDGLAASSAIQENNQFNTNANSEFQTEQQRDLLQSPSLCAAQAEVAPAKLSISPPTSSQGSSSDSSKRHKRKSSSASSQSAVCPADTIMTDGKDNQMWGADDVMAGGEDPSYALDNTGFPSLGGLSDPLSMDGDYDMSNKAMENHFDFDSAASSPSPFDAGIASGASSVGAGKSTELPFQRSLRAGNSIRYNGRMLPVSDNVSRCCHRLGAKAAFQHSPINPTEAILHGSREASPLSAMVTSQESSPSALLNGHSPSSSSSGDLGLGQTSNDRHHPPVWPPSYDFATGGIASSLSGSGLTTSPSLNSFSPSQAANMTPPRLTIHPAPLKSRVETQIPIKMTLFPVPPGVTKLHLPTHTISKPKLLAKPPVTKSPETLELSTMLVCTSAMRDPVKLRRAFLRAAGADPGSQKRPERRSSLGDVINDEEDDESKPLNGGEVVICPGCITRERKRAARKKMKKVDEEESWLKDEHRRVIVFNTHEVKEWQAPTKDSVAESEGDGPPPLVPDGAKQVDAPMRIACYCRHQNEKLGFQCVVPIP